MPEELYKIVRMYARDDVKNRTLQTGLTLDEAQEHCRDPETSSRHAKSDEATQHTAKYGHWFDGYDPC